METFHRPAKTPAPVRRTRSPRPIRGALLAASAVLVLALVTLPVAGSLAETSVVAEAVSRDGTPHVFSRFLGAAPCEDGEVVFTATWEASDDRPFTDAELEAGEGRWNRFGLTLEALDPTTGAWSPVDSDRAEAYLPATQDAVGTVQAGFLSVSGSTAPEGEVRLTMTAGYQDSTMERPRESAAWNTVTGCVVGGGPEPGGSGTVPKKDVYTTGQSMQECDWWVVEGKVPDPWPWCVTASADTYVWPWNTPQCPGDEKPGQWCLGANNGGGGEGLRNSGSVLIRGDAMVGSCRWEETLNWDACHEGTEDGYHAHPHPYTPGDYHSGSAEGERITPIAGERPITVTAFGFYGWR